MPILQGLADIAAIILILELLVILVMPAFLIAFFGRKGMNWTLVKFAWATTQLHTLLGTADKSVRRAEDVAVAPIIAVAAFSAGVRTVLRSLRRRANQPLSRLRRSP